MPKQQHYKIVKTAFAALFFLVFSAVALPSFSAGFGRLTVLSSLGQPLRAEVELLDVLPEESASLNAALAPVEAYRLSGMDYSPLLQSLKISVEKDGERHFISIRSPQSVNEPYIGLLLELASGKDRKGKEYAIMLDPQEWTNLRSAPLSSAASQENLSRQQKIGRRFSQLSSASVASPSAVLGQAEKKTEKTQDAVAGKKESEYKVSRGDSLSKIANRLGYRNISLEQMLVVLYRNNPDAFLNENMNLLKEGAVLSIPDIDKKADMSRQEAQAVVKLHATNFREYSLKLAELAQRSAHRSVPKTGSVSEGKITTRVREKPTPINQSPDRLELSKAQPNEGSKAVLPEEKIAINKAIEDTNQRITQLEKNVTELKSLLDVVSNKGKELVAPAESVVAKKKLAAQKAAEKDKKDIVEKAQPDDRDIPLPASEEDKKGKVPSEEKVPVTEKAGLSPDLTLAGTKGKEEKTKESDSKNTKADDGGEEESDEEEVDEDDADAQEDEEEEDDEEDDEEDVEKSDKKAQEDKKKAGFLQNLQSNRTLQIAIGGGVVLLILIVLLMKMMGRKKPKTPAAKTPSAPKEKSVEDVNPSIISGKDYLENLTGKEIFENEDADGEYRPMVDDDEESGRQAVLEEGSPDKDELPEEASKDSNEIQALSFATIENPVAGEPVQSDDVDEKTDQPETEEIGENTQTEEAKEEDSLLQQSEVIEENRQALVEENTEETSLELNLSDINLELEDGENASEKAALSETGTDEDYNAEMAAKLELALAYIEMKDSDGARELLEEVVVRGTPQQVLEAEKALQSI